MDTVVRIIGDSGESRVERTGDRYTVTHGDRIVVTNDAEYALTVGRHFAQYGTEGVVA